MVLKQSSTMKTVRLKFENDVKMYGTQTKWHLKLQKQEFENDVKMYGTQTHPAVWKVTKIV